MYESVVYQGDVVLGSVVIHPEEKIIHLKEIRISHFSQSSERCPPLAVLHTVTSTSVCFKMESKTTQQQDGLFHLHSLCIRENKTAIMPFGSEEIHLVAMYSRNNDRPCFWGFVVASGLYDSCLVMLNLRCLAIVFDLDETLIVANTMRSFEDRIEALQRKINSEVDPQRITGMQAEVKRYLDDKNILKQYAENDQVVDNGRIMKVQSEIVPALSESHQSIVRPLIRLQEKNIILTRINPQIRDTSVLVRLRPAWEDLRGYLTARGRKRFEVYVCTMAERDYALEMWRLLDPDSNLINTKELLDRIVCVKSGLKKSLFNVFQNGFCHPKMALVIDDRLKVWDEKDQPRVHVVPAFAPYYAPQAEVNFLPYTVGNSLLSVEAIIAAASSIPVATANLDPRLTTLLQYTVMPSDSVSPPKAQSSMMQFSSVPFLQPATLVKPMGQVAPPEPSLHSSPGREEGEVPESELDPDTRRRLLILQHGQDIRDHTSTEPPFPTSQPMQVSASHMPSRGAWFPVEVETGSQQLNRVVPKEFPVDSEPLHIEKHGRHRPSFFSKADNAISSDKILNESHQRLPKEMYHRDNRSRLSHKLSSYHSFSGDDIRLSRSFSSHRDPNSESGHSLLHADTPAVVLQEIALKCGTKVEFTSSLVASTELQFSVEAWFSGRRIGQGLGRTRKEAQHKASEESLKHLADIYLSRAEADSGSTYGNAKGFPKANDNGHVGNVNSPGNSSWPKEDSFSFSTSLDSSRVLDHRFEVSNGPMGPVSALKELCMMEGFGVRFQSLDAPASPNSSQKDAVYAQVEIDGQVFGKGTGLTWDEAKMQAAEKALGSLRSQNLQKQQGSPRSSPGLPTKRPKHEHPRNHQRFPSSGRYLRNASPYH
ncbi:unnamed protein product [Lupinus luteus]|uniref:protein-serine/threonine phosphatase n=1 Tax=Lupinus luteus TaxID=3873 RepID=A0AAV1WRX6_LUPLU